MWSSARGARVGNGLFWLLAWLLILPFSVAQGQTTATDQSALANRYFVGAMQSIARADQSYDLVEQARFLRAADDLLTAITTEVPESPLAVQLITGQFVGDFDYSAFKSRIRGLVCADGQSIRCMLHRIEALMTPVEYPVSAPRWDWLSLAVAHFHVGDKERVRPIIAPFLAAFRQQGSAGLAAQDLFLARALALTGEFDLALQITRSIPDCSTRIYNLHDITDAAIFLGRQEKARQVADEAAEFSRANGCAWELGLVARALLRSGHEDRARTLFLNTVQEQFSRFKEQKGECCPPELAIAAGEMGDPNLALGLLRTVQDGNSWAIPEVLGRLAARGEHSIPLAYADQIKEPELQAETFLALLIGAQKAGATAELKQASERLDSLLANTGPDGKPRLPQAANSASRDPIILVYRARADRALLSDTSWQSSYLAALTEAERADAERKDFAAVFLAALVAIETGKPLLD